MAIFNSYVKLPEGKWHKSAPRKILLHPQRTEISLHFGTAEPSLWLYQEHLVHLLQNFPHLL